MYPAATKILIVDDTALMRRMMRDLFIEMGYKALTDANDGAAAWKEYSQAAADGNPFELIISDWNMPKLSGLEFLKLVRDSAGGKTVPFLMLTAESEKDKVVEAIKAGVTGYITKPFTPDTVKQKVKAAYETSLKNAAAKAG